MAGMFYSLEEAAEKLNKTEEEVKQMAKEGMLREFRDGPALLFKVEEVDALISDEGTAESEEVVELEEVPELEESVEAEEISEPEGIPEVEATPEPQEVPESEEPEEFLMDSAELQASDLDTSISEAPEPEAAKTDIPEAAVPTPSEEDMDLDEILLSSDSEAPIMDADLTNADTAITGQGTSVLGQSDRDYELTDDTMAETAIPEGTKGTSAEVPLEEIEEDVNLDSIGSGSGLLDLSLQADDTSLGGILDEIYTTEGESQEPLGAESGSAAAMPAESDQMIHADEIDAQLPSTETPVLTGALIEPAQDSQGNMLAKILFLPLAVVIYTMIVAMAGMKSVIPSILESIQTLIWPIMGGLGGVTALVVIVSFMTGGERSATVKKKKEKKPKKEKVKKPKKPKKEKPPKPKKEKKRKKK